jgi:hypothetical protein
MDWIDEAKCRGMDVNKFHPGKGVDSQKIKNEILEIWNVCPVINECLEDALGDYLQIGYRGGKSAKERRQIASRRSREGNVSWKVRDVA